MQKKRTHLGERFEIQNAAEADPEARWELKRSTLQKITVQKVTVKQNYGTKSYCSKSKFKFKIKPIKS